MSRRSIKLAAALSYYTVFSLPPLLIIIISLSGFFFGAEAVRGEIFGQINGLVGNDAALQIQETIKNVKLSHASTFATILSAVILLIGASGVFVEIQDSINYIWGIKAKPKRGLVKFLKNRLMSFSMIGSVGFLLMVGLIVNSHLTLYCNFQNTSGWKNCVERQCNRCRIHSLFIYDRKICNRCLSWKLCPG